MRWIKGIVISSAAPNSNGHAFDTKDMVPVAGTLPLLAEHRWDSAIGRVTKVWTVGKQVHFEARLFDSDRLLWATNAWKAIADGRLVCVSIGKAQWDRADPTTKSWRFEEISICNIGADRGAQIVRCWERKPHGAPIQLNDAPNAAYRLHWSVEP